MAHDVELVEQDRRLRRFVLRDVAEWLPHVHYDEPDFAALLGPQPVVERRHAGLGTILAAEPDWPLAHQVADHDTIAVALADRDLVDADRSRTWCTGAVELGPHILHLQRLDRIPVEPEFLGDIADRCLPAAAADIKRKPFGEARIVRQKIQPFALHGAAMAARDAPHLEFQNNPKPCAWQIANLPHSPAVPTVPRLPATTADRFFDCRSRCNIRTSGSPNTPRKVSLARKPANEYPSDRRRRRFPDSTIPQHDKIKRASKAEKTPLHSVFRRYDPSKSPKITHSIP